MAESFKEMQVSVKLLLNTGEGGDVALVCNGKTWQVHSTYLWPRLSWFKAACRGGFKESETQRIELPEAEPSMIYRMLQYIYMQAYTIDLGFDPFWSVNDSWAKTRLHVHAQMYSLGNKYDLPGLKKEAAGRLENDVAIAGDRKRETLRLLSVVQSIYTTTPDSDRGLRNLVAGQIFQRYSIASKHFIEELDAALEVGQFARDMIVLHCSRPAVDFTTLAKKVRRLCLHGVRTLRAAAISASTTAAAFGARVPATGITLNGVVTFFGVAFGSTLFLFGVFLTIVFLLFIMGMTNFFEYAHLALREQYTTPSELRPMRVHLLLLRMREGTGFCQKFLTHEEFLRIYRDGFLVDEGGSTRR